jgi:hypothetical protein
MKRLEQLLPIDYFHVVFTIPDKLNPILLRNKRLVYDILFKAASQTLLQIAADEKHLGAQPGFTAILHTWGQNLLFHPHLHCVVTGGGLVPDGEEWVPSKDKFFLPVRVLSKLFRGKFLHMLKAAYENGDLELAGSTVHLKKPKAWQKLIDKLYRKAWVVYAKAPFGGPEQVFNYLGRYTHKVAISNHRLVAMEDGNVTFRLKDYTEDGKWKTMTVSATEFIRRFLLHVLPYRYMRIRHFGIMAGANVNTKLEKAKQILRSQQPDNSESDVDTTNETMRQKPSNSATYSDDKPWWESFFELTGVDVMACPKCKVGRMIRRPLPKVLMPP